MQILTQRTGYKTYSIIVLISCLICIEGQSDSKQVLYTPTQLKAQVSRPTLPPSNQQWKVVSMSLKSSSIATFQQFKTQNGKVYTSAGEQIYRSLIFQQNMQSITQHNSQANRTYDLAINKYADLSDEEFLSKYTKLMTKYGIQKQFSMTQTFQTSLIYEKNGSVAITRNTVNVWNQVQVTIADTQKNCKNITDNAKQIDNSNKTNNSSQQNTSNSENQGTQKSPIQAIDFSKLDGVDWTKVSGPVVDQGACGACYIFSVLDHVSSLYAIYGQKDQSQVQFTSLSAQQVIDCGYSEISQSCLGGYLEGAFAYVQKSGLQTSIKYPYRSYRTGKSGLCASSLGQFKITYFQTLQQGNCLALHQTLMKKTVPIGIAGYRLQFYQRGTFTDCNEHIDHAVLLIGYDQQKGWKIKNSWGTQWGEAGYAWIQGGKNCGICQMAVVGHIQGQELSP